MSRLVLCSACVRHVRRSEAACPFCGATVAPAALPRVLGPVLTRAALLVSGVAAAGASLSGCADDGQDEAEADDALPSPAEPERAASMAVPAYGVCIDDLEVRAPNCGRPIDAGTPVTPPASDAAVDGGSDASDGGKVDAGTPVLPPRLPPRRDGGIRVQPAYGVSLGRAKE